MRLLLVSHAYAPTLSPRAFRWTTLAEHWAAQGWQVDVVCSGVARLEIDPPGRQKAGDDNATGSSDARPRVHRVNPQRARVLRDLVARAEAQRAARGGPAPGSDRGESESSARRRMLRRLTSALAQFSRRAYDLTWKRVYWPDYTCLWYPVACRKVRQLLRDHHYDAMISSSVPFTSHMVALRAKRQQPSLRWIVDIGDPFAFSIDAPHNNLALYNGLNHRMEAKVLSAADAVTVTTAETAERYRAVFPVTTHKISVVPPVVTAPALNAAIAPPFTTASDRTRLAFAGTLYRRIRNPDRLIQTFRSLLGRQSAPEMELHFLGAAVDCAAVFDAHADLLGTRVFVHGMVSRQAAHSAMAAADILVNIGNDTTYQLPSKVLEYAAMGKPILNFASQPNDSSQQLLSSYPASLTVVGAASPSDLDRIEAFIQSPPRVDPRALAEWLEQFGVEAVASAYERILQCES